MKQKDGSSKNRGLSAPILLAACSGLGRQASGGEGRALLVVGPADPMPCLRGLMPRILFAMQIPAGGGDPGMAEVVTHVTQVRLPVGDVRAQPFFHAVVSS